MVSRRRAFRDTRGGTEQRAVAPLEPQRRCRPGRGCHLGPVGGFDCRRSATPRKAAWLAGRPPFFVSAFRNVGEVGPRGISDPPPRFGRVGLEFRSERGSSWACWFVDTRRFGCLALGVEADLHRGLGPDCLLTPLSGSALAARFPIRRSIKVALLEQDRIAGLGNIHAAEALWLAGIHPAVACDRLSAGDWDRLAAAIVRQVHAGIASFAGQLEVTYLSEGLEESRFFVYGREALPCQTCGSAIQREVQVQRGTWWCPTCQPDRGRDAEPRTG